MRRAAWILAVALAGCARFDAREAQAALDRGDLVQAEAAWRRALDRDPEREDALYGLGWTLHLAGERELARGAFEQLDRAHPTSPLGQRGLGSVALSERNVVLARSRFEEALRRAPGDPAVRQSLALLALTTGDTATALAQLDTLVQEFPDRAELHLARAEALVAQKRFDEARAATDTALVHAADAAPRVRAQVGVVRARTLLAATAGRVQDDDCDGTAPPVLTWLDAADRALDEVEAGGVVVPELYGIRRAVRRQRLRVRELCPGTE
jgi:tetratricopeptide (TPR) repeat protein